MIYKYSYILCRFIDSQNYKNDCYFQSFRRKNRYAARREQMIGRHNEPGFYSVLTGLFVAAAVGVYDMLVSDFSATSAPFKNIFIL